MQHHTLAEPKSKKMSKKLNLCPLDGAVLGNTNFCSRSVISRKDKVKEVVYAEQTLINLRAMKPLTTCLPYNFRSKNDNYFF